MEIQDLISENESLASLPKTFYFLQEAMKDPHSDFAQIEKIISHDPALTLRLFKIINSAFKAMENR